MDLRFSPAEEAFRDEVRAFLAAKLPARLADKVRTLKHLSKADMQEWHAILNARGWHANMIFCLVRSATDAKKQEGISFLLIDMASPGVELRPIITLDGEHEVNEVFFSDVRVPVENLVGEENKGWTCAKYLLTYERTNIAGVGFSVAALQRLKQIASKQIKRGRPLAHDPAFAARLARVEIELENMSTTNLRVIAAATTSSATKTTTSSASSRSAGPEGAR